MKKILCCLFIGAGIFTATAALAKNYVSAVVVTDSGVIKTDKLLVEDTQFKKGISLDVLVNGVKTRSQIPLELIDKIIISDSECRSGCDNAAVTGAVILKNGNRIEFENYSASYLFGTRKLRYENPDPVTGIPSRQSHLFNHVKTIEFKAVNGQFMVDSKGRVYPPDYQFSPYTGEKLTPQRK